MAPCHARTPYGDGDEHKSLCIASAIRSAERLWCGVEVHVGTSRALEQLNWVGDLGCCLYYSPVAQVHVCVDNDFVVHVHVDTSMTNSWRRGVCVSNNLMAQGHVCIYIDPLAQLHV